MNGSRSRKILAMLDCNNFNQTTKNNDSNDFEEILKTAFSNDIIFEDDQETSKRQENEVTGKNEEAAVRVEEYEMVEDYAGENLFNNENSVLLLHDQAIESNIMWQSALASFNTNESDVTQAGKETELAEEDDGNEADTGEDAESEEHRETETGDENVGMDVEQMEESFTERKQKQLSKKKQLRCLKDSGQSYIDLKGKQIPAKTMLRNPCKEKSCKNGCYTISESDRINVFNFFWKLGNSISQKRYLDNCVEVTNVKRHRKSKCMRQRNVTHKYYITKGNTKQQVCLQFLLNTLAVSHRLIRTIASKKEPKNFDKPDRRGRHVPHNKVSEEQITRLKMFVEALPAVPSHYCRSSTSRKYLPAETKSFNNLYRMYVHKQTELNESPIKKITFMALFKSRYNIGIHVPKKDKCIKCQKFENLGANRTKKDIEEHTLHIKEKDDAKRTFLKEQEESSEKKSLLVASFELQKVLATPHGDSMVLGFSRKYAVYNFTIYETFTRKGYCYLWGEKNGKRGSNEICTNLYNYLKRVDERKCYKEVSLYCDNCGGQNKNRTMFSMIRFFLDHSNFVEKINLKFLVTGHTYMPVDSMHAVIEKSLKHSIVQAPSEWSVILRNARIKPEPYTVVEPTYNDFLDFKSLLSKESFKVKISNIRTATFCKENYTIMYKSSFSENTDHSVLFELRNASVPKQLYKSELAICQKKYNDLKQLCQSLAIEAKYHVEYLTLRTNNTVPDVLPESDIED